LVITTYAPTVTIGGELFPGHASRRRVRGIRGMTPKSIKQRRNREAQILAELVAVADDW
jgi:hypothetical protein